MKLEFDRGTLLLRDVPPDRAAGLPSALRWDPRVRCHRAPAHAYAQLTRELTHLSVPYEDAVCRASVPLSPIAWTSPELRPYQATALLAWEMAGRRGIVALPTGSGKTLVAVAAAARTGLPTLVLVPTRVLLEQWLAVLSRQQADDIGCYGDGDRRIAPVTVATFESAYRHMPVLGHRFGLLVVDEAHHLGASLRDEVLESSIAGARLGLTATPPQGERQRERLRELIGPMVYELAIGDLAGTYLSSFDLMVLEVDLTLAERTVYDADAAELGRALRGFFIANPRAEWKDFAREANRTEAGQRALAAMRRMRALRGFSQRKAEMVSALLRRHADARVLVFTPDNTAAYAIAQRDLVMPITCAIGRAERTSALESFRAGRLHALVSAQVLNEGLDVPDADVAIVVGGSLGEREHVQRVGRVLRPRPGKRAIVYELVSSATAETQQARRRRRGLGPHVHAQL